MQRNISQTIMALFVLGAVVGISLGYGANSAQSNRITNSRLVVHNPFANYLMEEKLTLLFVGDIMMHEPIRRSGEIGNTNEYNFSPIFSEVKEYIESVDIAIANLETPAIGRVESDYSGYPMFNSPYQIIDALKETGFDVISFANNHSLDRGNKGVIGTVENIEHAGLVSIGVTSTSHAGYFVTEKNNIKVGIVSATYGMNGFTQNTSVSHRVNIINSARMQEEYNTLKGEGVEYAIAYLHAGVEYQRSPSQSQRQFAQKLVDMGYDAVVMAHPHVVQGAEYLTDKNGRKKVVMYSLGNFIANQHDTYTDMGAIFELELTKTGEGEIEAGAMVFPTTHFRYNSMQGRPYKVRLLSSMNPESDGYKYSNEQLRRIQHYQSLSITTIKE